MLIDISTRDVTAADIEDLFRSIHTIKGGAVMFGWSNTQQMSRELESYLGTCKTNMSLFDLRNVMISVDQIENYLENNDKLQSKEDSVENVPATIEIQNHEIINGSTHNTEVHLQTSRKEVEKNVSSTKSVKSDVLRIPLNKVNNTLNSIWEIFLIRNQISYLFEKNKKFLKTNSDMLQEWELLDNSLKRNISELESTAMSMRMDNLSSLFARMNKVVREYQKNSSKDIHFLTDGEQIELDKKVIDMLGEPLIHLVRNAMDHGVEAAEQRKLHNKPPKGNITLTAETLTDRVQIKIQDDGKGIDPQKLKEKAIKLGWDLSKYKTDKELINLIFESGFSTAEVVTDVSGRGVGMDAVRRSIQKIGGEIFIDSKIGKGTTFTIEIPLSLSVISSIIYEINGKCYASSISNLTEICRENIDVINQNNQETYFSYRNEFIRSYDLTKVFDKHENQADLNSKEEFSTFCVLNEENELVALKVSKVLRHTEIVVKEVKGVFPDLDYVSGVSILATGEPVFVLSLSNIYKKLKNEWSQYAA